MSCPKAVLLSVLYQFASTSNLFKYLRRRYDHQLVRDLNHLIRLKGKWVRNRQGIQFLGKCLEHRLTPVNIRQRVSKVKPKNPYTIERAFIRDEIEKKQDFLKHVVAEFNAKFRICKKLTFMDKLRFCKLLNQTAERLSQSTRTKNNKTLQWLLNKQHGSGVLRHSTIVNLTDVEFSEAEKNVLCRGLNYGLPPRINQEAIQAEFELCWQQLDELTTTDERRKQCKATLIDIEQRYVHAKSR